MVAYRRLALLPLMLGIGACTAILGDFPPAQTRVISSEGGEGGAADATGGVAISDTGAFDGPSTLPSDGPSAIDSPVDSRPESGTTLRKLRCSDSGPSSRTPLTMGITSHRPDAIRMANLPGGSVRVVVVDYPMVDGSSPPAVLRAYTYSENNSSSVIATADLPTNTG